MEITLNLLPPYIQRQRDLQKRRRVRNVAMAAAVLPFVLAYAVLNARIRMLEVRAAILDHQVAALGPLADKSRGLDRDLAEMKRREGALNRLTVRLPRWSGVLVQLSDLVPPEAWLTSLSITNGQIIITGEAVSEGTVSALATRVSSARFLTGTSLKYVREGTAGTRRIYTFEIDGSVRTEGQAP